MPNRRQAVNGLPDRAWLLLRYGDTEDRYDGDGSRLVGAVVVMAVNSGANRDWVRSLLADPQHPGGFAALRRRRDVNEWFDREWSRAVAMVRSSPPVTGRFDATLRAAELAEHAESLGWRGVGGATDLAVYGFALGVAARAGRLGPLALASRAVAEGVGITRSTAAVSLGRLVDRKLLRRVESGTGKFATQFAVTDAPRTQGDGRRSDTGSGQRPPEQEPLDNPGEVDGRTPDTGSSEGQADAPRTQGRDNPGESGGRTPDIRVTHSSSWSCGGVSELRPPSETWRWPALGLSKHRTWLALDPVESVTAGALAEHLGVTSRTARRHLAVLVDHGLAERLEGEYRRTGRDPQSLADELGMAGMAERQRQRHELERKLHAEARAAYAACSIGAPAVDPETGEIADHRRPPDPPDDAEQGWKRYLAPDPPQAVPAVPPVPGRSEGVPEVPGEESVPVPQPVPGTSAVPDTPPLSREVPQVPQVPDDGGGEPPYPALVLAAFPGSVVVDLPEGLVDLPFDEVGACRVCAGATVTTDETGPIHGRCRGAA
jgi:DNA-binding transcriptional ArsR family regulator